MRKIIIALTIMATIWACSNSESGKEEVLDKDGGTMAAKEPKQIDGKKVYKQYCVTCHGLYGDMGASGAYNLQTSELPVEERMNVIKNGRGNMAGLGNLMSEAQIKAVAEYTLTISETSE